MKSFFKYVLATIVGVIILWIVAGVLFFVVVGVVVSSSDDKVEVKNNSMLVLELNKTIVDRAKKGSFEDLDLEIPGFKSESTVGLNDITASLEKAATDDRIKGVYLELSMVRGGMASIEEIRDALIEFKNNCNKPIYAYGEFLGQKSYYLASVADTIALHPMGSVDFRGLGGEMLFMKNMFDKLGVEMQVVRHGKFKAAVEPLIKTKMSDENREQQLVYLKSMWNHMLKGISEKRSLSIEQLNQLADEVQSLKKGGKAVKSGLVDLVKYKDQVLDDLRAITGIKENKKIPIIGVSKYAKVYVEKKDKKGLSRNKVAVIYASGSIGESSSFGSKSIIGDKLSKEIRKVRTDSTYKAIVLRVNSPGGSVFDSEEIWREMKLASDEKTVVVSFGDVAASGGYYISCPADVIVAQPNTITGSIGIFGVIPNNQKLMNKHLGITTDKVETNEHSSFLSTNRPMTPFERDLMQQSIEEGYDTFISHVAEGRKMSKTKVDSVGQGRVWTGENALELGLIDQLGGLEDAIAIAAEKENLENYRTVNLPKEKDPFEELLKMGKEDVKASFIKHELGDSYEYYKAVKRISKMNGLYMRMPYDISIN